MVVHSIGEDYKQLDKLNLDTKSWERRFKSPGEEYPSFARMNSIGKTHVIASSIEY